jgi:hypothetical protein
MRGMSVLVGGLVLIGAGIALLAIDGAGTTGRLRTNGERIYFTGRNESGQRIAYRGGSSSGMMMAGGLACVSCHGGNAEGGQHRMHMILMDAPSIRWSALAEDAAAEANHGTYDLATLRRAIVEGRHPNGEPLSDLMPRWQMSDRDLADLAAYLQSLD